MLKIKILKSGKYALHPAWGGIIDFNKGDEFIEDDVLIDVEGKKTNASNELNLFSREVALRMEASKWAKLINKVPKKEEPEPKESPLLEFLNILKDVKGEKERKAKIQDWGVVNCGIKPSKSKSVENMIKELEDYFSSF